MVNKWLLGKVFISHSSKDKDFVRKLSKKIEEAGFQVWLDEKELVVGDAISTKISEALEKAGVVLVVVSKASLESRWLAFELNKATDRMIQGKCRVIPAVIEKTELPPEVRGLLYADFASSFDFGLKSVLIALQHEAHARSISYSFWSRADALVDEVFDSRGRVSLSGEYKSEDYEVIEFSTEDHPEVSVLYETVSHYYGNVKPLSSQWWDEFQQELDNRSERLALVITERPLGFPVTIKHESNPRVSAKAVIGYKNVVYSYTVFVDLSGIQDHDQQRADIVDARNLISLLSKGL